LKYNKNRIFFFGAFSFFKSGNLAYAASGSQVQLEIIKSIKKIFSYDSFTSFIFEPNKTWPFSSVYIKKNHNSEIFFHTYINIKYIRELHILYKRIIQIILNKPDYIFIYNITFLESIIYNVFQKIYKFKVILFIQDINENNLLVILLNKLTFKLASNFDILIPITNNIIDDFNLPKNKCILFSGGFTEIALKMQQNCLNNQSLKLYPKAVFAGRLEKYNGIDKLVDYWIKKNIKYELHIYGSGSYIKELEKIIHLNPKIRYFGLVSDIDVFNIQSHSTVNICLRYSIDLNQNYFFPSKIFNLLSAPGTVLVNNFNNIPIEMLRYCDLLDEDFNNLNEILNRSNDFNFYNYNKRIDWIKNFASWEELIKKIKLKLVQ
jgi:hypothetical protein